MRLRSLLSRNIPHGCHRLLLHAGGYALALCWLSSVARADPPRILLVSEPNVPAKLEASVSQGLDPVGIVGKSDEYLTAARAQHLSPTSDAALTRIATRARARLIVALTLERKKLLVSYRNGTTGEVVAKQTFPASRQRPLSSHARRKLSVTARHALARLGREPAPEAPRAPEAPPRPMARAAPQTPVASYTEPPHNATEVEPPQQPLAAAPVETSTQDDTPAPEPAANAEPAVTSDAPDANGFLVLGSVGTGVAERLIHLPGRFGGSTMGTGLTFPALEARVGAQGMLSSQWLLAGEMYYRTVFGLEAQGETRQRSISSHSFILGVAPGYRFDEAGSVEVRVLIGAAYRSLVPVNTNLPSSRPFGALLRPELRITLIDRLSLRIAPELIVAIGLGAQARGTAVPGLAAVGFGVGGEVSLDYWLAGPLSAGLEYRESRVLVGSSAGEPFVDLERMVIARALLQI